MSLPRPLRISHLTTHHGESFDDPYFWLREREDPRVRAHLEAENAFTEAAMAPTQVLQSQLYTEMVARIEETDCEPPYRDGDYWYYSRTVQGLQYPIYCRRADCSDAIEEILIDLNREAVGHAYAAVGALAVSDDGRWLAYTLDTTGGLDYTLRIKDLRGSSVVPWQVDNVSSVEWASHGDVYYVTMDDAKRSHRLWRRALDAAEGTLLYEEADALYSLDVARTRDRHYLIAESRSTTTVETRYCAADDPTGVFRLLLPREEGHEYDIEHREGMWILRTNRAAKNFRIVVTPVATPDPAAWRELVSHRDDVLLEDYDVFQSALVVWERTAGVPQLRVCSWDGTHLPSLTLPDPIYELAPDENHEFAATIFRFAYSSLRMPRTIYALDLGTQQLTVLKRDTIHGHDPEQYTVERDWATARDGTRVPISLVRRHDRRTKGPLLLYGYGAYGLGSPADFRSTRLSLLDRGWTYAIAHVRGGNELGEAWHDGGKLLAKPNTFSDFIACAEHLIAQGATTPAQLFISGGSAGGLLMGAVVNQRPELFAGVFTRVPFVDVLNTMSDPTLPLTVGEYLEWGNPADPASYACMRGYCPYSNVRAQAYPALLVTTGINDNQVQYWEPAKWVARLRDHTTSDRPILLKIHLEAGHRGASGRYDAFRETAFQYAWLLWRQADGVESAA